MCILHALREVARDLVRHASRELLDRPAARRLVFHPERGSRLRNCVDHGVFLEWKADGAFSWTAIRAEEQGKDGTFERVRCLTGKRIRQDRPMKVIEAAIDVGSI